jgi:hypothetical protein
MSLAKWVPSHFSPSSLAYGIAVLFESQRKARRRFTHPPRTKMAPGRVLIFVFAEDVGFEPTRSFTLWRFSKPLPSATRPILQYIHFNHHFCGGDIIDCICVDAKSCSSNEVLVYSDQRFLLFSTINLGERNAYCWRLAFVWQRAPHILGVCRLSACDDSHHDYDRNGLLPSGQGAPCP